MIDTEKKYVTRTGQAIQTWPSIEAWLNHIKQQGDKS